MKGQTATLLRPNSLGSNYRNSSTSFCYTKFSPLSKLFDLSFFSLLYTSNGNSSFFKTAQFWTNEKSVLFNIFILIGGLEKCWRRSVRHSKKKIIFFSWYVLKLFGFRRLNNLPSKNYTVRFCLQGKHLGNLSLTKHVVYF